MDFNKRLKYLKDKIGFVTNEKLEYEIESCVIPLDGSDFVWNSINLTCLFEIKCLLEKEIPDVTATLMEAMEDEQYYYREIPVLNHFLDVLVAIKDKVDDSAAGNVNISDIKKGDIEHD